MRTYSARQPRRWRAPASPALPGAAAILLAVLAWPWPAAHAEPLGRLFFTPAERIRLDTPATLAPPPAPPPRLDGIVTRSAGRPTVFVDGRASDADPREVRIDDATARITGADGRAHRLHVGAPSSGGAP